jgi:hypothetical protein
MNPALLNFGLAQEQADGALGSTNSPISNGALTAIRSVKQSLAMDEAEKRRALGLGLMGFASSLSQPGYGRGLSGMLGAVNAGFSPAIQAYLNEQNRVEQRNSNILKTAVDAEDKQAERDYKEKHLQEMARHNKASEAINSVGADVTRALNKIKLEEESYLAKQRKNLREQDNEIYKSTGDRVESIKTMPYSTQLHLEKTGEEYLTKANSANEGLSAIATMKDVLAKKPELFGTWKAVQQYSFNHDPTQVKQLIMSLSIPEEDKEALFTFSTAAKDVLIKGIKQLPNNAVNQQFEKFMMSVNPNTQMPVGTLIKNLDKLENSFSYSAQEYNKGVDYFNKGKIYRPKAFDPKTKYQNGYNQEPIVNQNIEVKNDSSASKKEQIIKLQDKDGNIINFNLGQYGEEGLRQAEADGFERIE